MPGKQANPLDNPILAEHAAEIRKLGKRVVEDVIEIGRHLVEARAEVKKLGGSWADWLKHEFEWEQAQAYRFIQVYERKSELINLINSDLPVSALYLLAAPSTPDEARAEIVERAKAGETIPVAEVKRTIEHAKGRKQPARKPRKTGQRGGRLRQSAGGGGIVDEAVERRDDIGPASADEVARKDTDEIEELRTAKRRLEIRVTGLESEIEELKAERKPASDSKAASRCSICHEKKHAVQRPVFICDDCVSIYDVGEVAPPVREH